VPSPDTPFGSRAEQSHLNSSRVRIKQLKISGHYALDKDGRAWKFASRVSFGFLRQAPELKSLRIDSFFDCSPREIMRRGLLRPYRAGGGPGTKLLWKPAAREIAREGQQTFPGFRLENVNPHGSTFCGDGGMQTVPPRRANQAALCVIRSTCTIFAVRHGNGGDAEADRRTERQAK
jgi:hypothetical protein